MVVLIARLRIFHVYTRNVNIAVEELQYTSPKLKIKHLLPKVHTVPSKRFIKYKHLHRSSLKFLVTLACPVLRHNREISYVFDHSRSLKPHFVIWVTNFEEDYRMDFHIWPSRDSKKDYILIRFRSK